jgi:hypothetical protein
MQRIGVQPAYVLADERTVHQTLYQVPVLKHQDYFQGHHIRLHLYILRNCERYSTNFGKLLRVRMVQCGSRPILLDQLEDLRWHGSGERHA